jgi:hypothetical protein
MKTLKSLKKLITVKSKTEEVNLLSLRKRF